MRRVSRSLQVLLISGLLVGALPGAVPATAVADTLCSSLVSVGPVTAPSSFNNAINEVNAGNCNVIDVSANITFTAQPIEIDPPNGMATLIIRGPVGGATLDGKDGASAAVPGLEVVLQPSQNLEMHGLTLRDFNRASSCSLYSGGAISTRGGGDVSVQDSSFTANLTACAGGAISTTGSIVSIDSAYSSNVAGQDGGALSAAGSVTSTGDVFTSNSTDSFDGGAVRAAAQFIGNHSQFTTNISARHGGAIMAGSFTDEGSTFSGNAADDRGGAIYAGVTPVSGDVIQGSTFTSNSAGSTGGAIYTFRGLSSTDASFTSNTAIVGGAVSASGAVTLVDSDFTTNSVVDNSSPTAYGNGGAIHISAVEPLTLTGGTFEGNSSDGNGGGIVTGGSVTATDATFTANEAGVQADSGGGAIVADGDVVVTGVTFTNNVTKNGGGGAVFTSGIFTANSSTFTGNRHVSEAGSSFTYNGGAVRAAGQVSVTDSTFSGNISLSAAGAIFTDSGAAIQGSDFVSNTSVDNGGAIYVTEDIEIEDSLFEANVVYSASGGGVSSRDATISRSTFRLNSSATFGGGVVARALVVDSSSFVENIGAFGGGARAATIDVTNSTFYENSAGWGGALLLASGGSATIRFSTLVREASGSFPQGSVFTSENNVPSANLTLIGSVLSGPSPVCGFDFTSSSSALQIAAASRSSFTTDASCVSTTADAVRTTDNSSLGFATPLTTDVPPGMQVLIPDQASILNGYAPTSLLPSGVTTDQLGAARNSSNGLTSVGAVQVRDTSIAGPSNVSVAPGSNATFSVTAVPGVGTTATYQWQTSPNGSSWSNVSGAVTSSLTLPAVGLGDSGLRVRVNVTDRTGSTTSSSPATLSVGYPAPSVDPSPSPSPSPAATTAPVTLAPTPTATATPTPAIAIRATRSGSDIIFWGRVTGFEGTRVRPMVKLQGSRAFERDSFVPVNGRGVFTWRYRTAKAAAVYFTMGRVESNVVRVRAKPQS